MKKVSQSVDDTLLDYLDGNLSAADKNKVEQAIRNNKDWQTRLEELRMVSTVMNETKHFQPSKNFTQLVMSKLDQYPAQHHFPVWKGIFLLIGILLAVGIATVLVSSGAFDDTTTSIDLNQVYLSKKFINEPLPSFHFSGRLIVNIIIILNLGLAWILLDRTILKPFFQRRMQGQH